MYRFAYGRYWQEDFGQQLVFGQTSGAYLTYLKASGSGVLERRLLAFRNERQVRGVRAIELYRENGGLRLRTGLIAPRIGMHSVLLSDEIHPAHAAHLLHAFARNDHGAALADDILKEALQSQESRSWLEMQSLAFYSLRSDGPSKISGALLDRERFGAMVGRRVDNDTITPEDIKSLAPLGRSHEADLSQADRILIDEMPRLSIDELMRDVASRIEAG